MRDYWRYIIVEVQGFVLRVWILKNSNYLSSYFLYSLPHKLTSCIFWPCHLTLFWLVFLWNSLLQALHALSLYGWKFKMAIQWVFFAWLFFIPWVTDYLFFYHLNIHVSWLLLMGWFFNVSLTNIEFGLWLLKLLIVICSIFKKCCYFSY